MMSGMYNSTIIVKCLLKMDKKIDKWLKNAEKTQTFLHYWQKKKSEIKEKWISGKHRVVRYVWTSTTLDINLLIYLIYQSQIVWHFTEKPESSAN